ncbi:conserved telomere maintenance component 1 [Zea mays]|uniref:CST complex subunit CTC1 n=1 Tax=Zea mays TaxID=4577 RepID=A0A1D6I3F7_MAIZE|nr:conserved telomere maintenance component 1 [Zea mays]
MLQQMMTNVAPVNNIFPAPLIQEFSWHGLFLTSETYIEVSSISHANLTEQSVISSPKSNLSKDGSFCTASPCLFFHQKYFTDSRPMQFHCRVATILVLVLNKSTNQGETPNVKVRLAGFILDDGSSLCCGWADDARAELLLRLQEIVHLDASVNLKLSKGGENSTKLKYTIGCCLEKMLKQHTSVTNVMASALSPDDINGFNVELPVPVQNMRMLWIEEVFPVDPLEEARRLHDILENS